MDDAYDNDAYDDDDVYDYHDDSDGWPIKKICDDGGVEKDKSLPGLISAH